MNNDWVGVDELIFEITDKNDYADMAAEKLLRRCSTSWESYQYPRDRVRDGETIVVSYHFWTFEAPGDSPNPAWLALFKQYIDHLKSRGDVIFTTLSGQPLMNPSPAPAVCPQDGNSHAVFAQGTYHALWNKHYQPGSGWSAWEYLGGYLTSSPAATSPANGVVDVFVRGTNGALWKSSYNNGSYAWASIGSTWS